MTSFSPIAIVGQSCLLPGAHSPDQLWQHVASSRSLIASAPSGRWGIEGDRILTPDPAQSDDRAWSDKGGYVDGFDAVFDPNHFQLPAELVSQLDPLFQWVLHTGREALADAGLAPSARTGAIFGNLSFPSSGLSRFAEQTWFPELMQAAGLSDVRPENRYMSGLPAHLLAAGLGLGAGAFALDAACASSLYAIKLACDKLQDGSADVMLAGAVNRADDLFIHVGFCALNALSKTGQSRPFHAGADGLIPGEGCGMVALMRLEDAVAAGKTIHGVIRGVGLSNDGRGRGLLAPSSEGQARAIRLAYEGAGLSPSDVDYVECHATGTPVGDATEIRSMADVFTGRRSLPIGSLKGNLGHLITAAGVAGLIKVLQAMKHQTLPPSPHVDDSVINPAVPDSPFEVLSEPRPWTSNGPRRAAVSAFGFGGNNAHLIVEEWQGQSIPAQAPAPVEPIAITAVAARVADLPDTAAFTDALLMGLSRVRAGEDGPEAPAADVTLSMRGLKFPPKDLEQSLAQQTLLLSAAREACGSLQLPRDTTGILIGMQADAEVARYGARWRAKQWGESLGLDEAWVSGAREGIVPVLSSPGVVGTMPNIPANRLNSQLDLGGPSYTVSAEELSGIRALEIGVRALRAGELDAAVIGAVDLSCEPVHRRAGALLPPSQQTPGDAAVVLVLERLSDAVARGHDVVAVLDDSVSDPARLVFGVDPELPGLQDLFGHAHAASGLLHVAAAALSLRHRAFPAILGGHGPVPWQSPRREAEVVVTAMAGQQARVGLSEAPRPDSADHAVTAAGPASPEAFRSALAASQLDLPTPHLNFPAHPARPAVPALPAALARPATSPSSLPTRAPVAPVAPSSRRSRGNTMQPAPKLPSALEAHRYTPAPLTRADLGLPAESAPAATPPPAAAGAAWSRPTQAPTTSWTTPAAPVAAAAPPALDGNDPLAAVYASINAYQAQLGAMHQQFLQQQSDVHQQFLRLRQEALLGLVHAGTQPGIAQPPAAPQPAAIPQVPVMARPAAPAATPSWTPPPSASPVPSVLRSPAVPKTPAAAEAPVAQPAAAKPVAKPPAAKPVAKPASKAAAPKAKGGKPKRPVIEPDPRTPFGLTLDKDQLRIHASGNISEIYGDMFKPQDSHAVQCRMPEDPLLLADRVVGLDAEPGSMGLGTIWTETDVTADAWYLHDGRMPAGVLIESGQADLMLISYLGIDLLHDGERKYRLLGCELTYRGDLPGIGETIRYDIHVDGHAKHGDIRLFFFHYDCFTTEGRPILTVREGQAGFFTEEDLEDSDGILWTPEEQELVANPRLDAPAVPVSKASFTRQQLEDFSEGDGYACFGEGFEYLQTHNRPPRIGSGRMLFADRVDTFDPKGGPWKRGYLHATQKISPDDWFFKGHFKNDPCMPGTLMFEGCLQLMAFYLSALGYTINKDGWRFQPVPNEPYQLLCRGQVDPDNEILTYEIFVEEVHDGPYPTLVADLLCTSDGLKAFHARRMMLQLVPDWPMTSLPDILDGHTEPKDVAKDGDGFPFDYKSLLACAWGKPSTAFGKMYEPFDDVRKVARLPGPPYHFMSRVTSMSQDVGQFKSGMKVTMEYDVPGVEEWYFTENHHPTMPYCVLLEAALQPCGWVSSALGSALQSPNDLLYRNLDGDGTVHIEIPPDGGTFRTDVHITSVSKSGDMIIQSFDVKCYLINGDDDPLAYSLKTVFGFFPPEAFEDQAGLPVKPEERALYESPSDFLVDLTSAPERYCGGTARLPNPMLLMLDRVDACDSTGGRYGNGFARGQKDVDPKEWFFKAHFYQDPVQPGSLGIEAMIQLLQFWMLEQGMDEGIESPRFEAIMVGGDTKWKYRGQVVPRNKLISSTLEIIETGEDDKGRFAICDASLWIDGKRSYEAKRLGMRIVSGGLPKGTTPLSTAKPTPVHTVYPHGPIAHRLLASTGSTSGASNAQTRGEERLSLADQPWLEDHCPTWVLPALPLMSMVDRLAGAGLDALGRRPEDGPFGLADVAVHRWVPVPDAIRLNINAEASNGQATAKLQLWRDAPKAELSRFEDAATGTVLASAPDFAPELPALENAETIADPYGAGTLFHGPTLQLLESLELGSNGSTSWLSASTTVPLNHLNQALLDAATHGIPHDALHRWSDRISEDVVAYPYRIPTAWFAGPLPSTGRIRCETRFAGFDGDDRFPMFDVVLFSEAGERIAALRLVEICLPKGRIGSAAPEDRVAFLRDRRFVEGLALSELDGDTTRLTTSEVKQSDWLPGTVERIYGSTDPRAIVVQEHVGQRAGVHPGDVEPDGNIPSMPLNHVAFLLDKRNGEGVVAMGGKLELELSQIRQFWSDWFDIGRWPVEDLYYGLINRFVGKVVLEDPEAFAKTHGQSVVFLGNHQVGIESLLFSIISGALNGNTTVTVAKDEHRQTWLGQLITHNFAYPGVRDPQVITYFDRADKASLPRIVGELAAEMVSPGKNVMVHVEGTRSTSCVNPVMKMSGKFLDMATEVGAPVIPVRFIGGLPRDPLAERIEFPIGMGRQDIHIGTPIYPEELKALPYKERKQRVMDGINRMGVPNAEEQPLPGDPEFAAKVQARVDATGVEPHHAVLFEVLAEIEDPGDQVQALLAGAEAGTLTLENTPHGDWTARLAEKLFGSKGPKITRS